MNWILNDNGGWVLKVMCEFWFLCFVNLFNRFRFVFILIVNLVYNILLFMFDEEVCGFIWGRVVV